MDRIDVFVIVVCGVVAGLIAYRLLNVVLAVLQAYVIEPISSLFKNRE